MKKLLLLCFIFSCGYFGCGSTDGALSTSSMTATIDTVLLDADVVSWVDALGVKATACAPTSFPAIPKPNSVNLSVVSKLYSNTGTMGLPVRIDSAVISYVPANSNTPAMASVFQTVNMTIASGATASLPVRVVTTEQKSALAPTLGCTATIYNYYTTITLNITEIGTDRKSSVDASMQLRLGDYIDI